MLCFPLGSKKLEDDVRWAISAKNPKQRFRHLLKNWRDRGLLSKEQSDELWKLFTERLDREKLENKKIIK